MKRKRKHPIRRKPMHFAEGKEVTCCGLKKVTHWTPNMDEVDCKRCIKMRNALRQNPFAEED